VGTLTFGTANVSRQLESSDQLEKWRSNEIDHITALLSDDIHQQADEEQTISTIVCHACRRGAVSEVYPDQCDVAMWMMFYSCALTTI
tara:strand:- start:176 stop:439 length:264 start_codon:yes stop_codon:yes gene_type:complete